MSATESLKLRINDLMKKEDTKELIKIKNEIREKITNNYQGAIAESLEHIAFEIEIYLRSK